jgi:hypothetical protein
MTLSEAVSRGLTRYFTGKPCKRGHIAQRNTLTSACLKCMGVHQKNRRQRLNFNKLLDSQGFVEVKVKIKPDDRELLTEFIELLNKWHLEPDGTDYIKLLSDYANALYQASILFRRKNHDENV